MGGAWGLTRHGVCAHPSQPGGRGPWRRVWLPRWQGVADRSGRGSGAGGPPPLGSGRAPGSRPARRGPGGGEPPGTTRRSVSYPVNGVHPSQVATVATALSTVAVATTSPRWRRTQQEGVLDALGSDAIWCSSLISYRDFDTRPVLLAGRAGRFFCASDPLVWPRKGNFAGVSPETGTRLHLGGVTLEHRNMMACRRALGFFDERWTHHFSVIGNGGARWFPVHDGPYSKLSGVCAAQR